MYVCVQLPVLIRAGLDPQASGAFVELTPLAHVPNSAIDRYLGRVDVHFIKEMWNVEEKGGT